MVLLSGQYQLYLHERAIWIALLFPQTSAISVQMLGSVSGFWALSRATGLGLLSPLGTWSKCVPMGCAGAAAPTPGFFLPLLSAVNQNALKALLFATCPAWYSVIRTGFWIFVGNTNLVCPPFSISTVSPIPRSFQVSVFAHLYDWSSKVWIAYNAENFQALDWILIFSFWNT